MRSPNAVDLIRMCNSRGNGIVASALIRVLRAFTMTQVSTNDQLCSIKCVPCEGGVPRLTVDEAVKQLREVEGWTLLAEPDRMTKSWTAKNFVAAMQFFQKVTDLAESEGHHPDLHLVGYRNVTIDIWTHAINGLSLNDFILAAKIDQLPFELKTAPA